MPAGKSFAPARADARPGGCTFARQPEFPAYAALAVAAVLGFTLQVAGRTGDFTIPLGGLGILGGYFSYAPPLAWHRRGLSTPEGEVDIVAWAGYIERGANDPTVDWVTGFEKETGCTVKVKDAATSDEMVQLINGGGYDLVTASGDASLRLVYGNSVQEIDTSRIPSYCKVDPRLQDAPWHTVDGKHYGVPYQWGPNVLMYNTTVFPRRPRPGMSSSRR